MLSGISERSEYFHLLDEHTQKFEELLETLIQKDSRKTNNITNNICETPGINLTHFVWCQLMLSEISQLSPQEEMSKKDNSPLTNIMGLYIIVCEDNGSIISSEEKSTALRDAVSLRLPYLVKRLMMRDVWKDISAEDKELGVNFLESLKPTANTEEMQLFVEAVKNDDLETVKHILESGSKQAIYDLICEQPRVAFKKLPLLPRSQVNIIQLLLDSNPIFNNELRSQAFLDGVENKKTHFVKHMLHIVYHDISTADKIKALKCDTNYKTFEVVFNYCKDEISNQISPLEKEELFKIATEKGYRFMELLLNHWNNDLSADLKEWALNYAVNDEEQPKAKVPLEKVVDEAEPNNSYEPLEGSPTVINSPGAKRKRPEKSNASENLLNDSNHKPKRDRQPQ